MCRWHISHLTYTHIHIYRFRHIHILIHHIRHIHTSICHGRPIQYITSTYIHNIYRIRDTHISKYIAFDIYTDTDTETDTEADAEDKHSHSHSHSHNHRRRRHRHRHRRRHRHRNSHPAHPLGNPRIQPKVVHNRCTSKIKREKRSFI